MGRGTLVGHVEIKNNTKESHEIYAVLHGLQLRGSASNRPRVWVTSIQSLQWADKQGDSRECGRPARGSSRHGPPQLSKVPVEASTLPWQAHSQERPECGRPRPTSTAKQSRMPQANSTLGEPINGGWGLEARNVQAHGQKRGGLHQRMEHRTTMSLLHLELRGFTFSCASYTIEALWMNMWINESTFSSNARYYQLNLNVRRKSRLWPIIVDTPLGASRGNPPTGS